MMLDRRRLCLGAAGMALAGAARAQPDGHLPAPPLTADFATRLAVNLYSQTIGPAFVSAATPGELAVMRTLDIRWDPTNARIDDVYASVDASGKPYIKLSGGFLLTFLQAARAIAVAQAWSGPRTAADVANMTYLSDYIGALTKAVLQQIQAQARGEEASMLVVPFGTFIGKSEPEVDDFIVDRNLAPLITEIYTEGLAFVLGHEIGHHIHGDLWKGGDARAKRAMESAADGFGVSLCMRAGFAPIAVLPVMSVIMTLEGDPANARADADHPQTACRMVDLWDASRDLAERDPAFSANLAAHPDKQELWTQVRAALSDAADRAAPVCRPY